jgi:hypothetical protein
VLEVLQRGGVIDLIGAEHIHDEVADAVESFATIGGKRS